MRRYFISFTLPYRSHSSRRAYVRVWGGGKTGHGVSQTVFSRNRRDDALLCEDEVAKPNLKVVSKTLVLLCSFKSLCERLKIATLVCSHFQMSSMLVCACAVSQVSQSRYYTEEEKK